MNIGKMRIKPRNKLGNPAWKKGILPPTAWTAENHPKSPGRPKSNLIHLISAELQKEVIEKIGTGVSERIIKRTKEALLAERIVDEAVAGNHPFVEIVLDRIIGKVKDRLEIDSNASITPQEMFIMARRVMESQKQQQLECGGSEVPPPIRKIEPEPT